jgi:von Willebrand factor type A domain
MRKAFAIAAAVGILAAATGFAAARPRVEVAFVLDSTGSMGGLIEGAKQKIWSIANGIIVQKPTPEVSIGLVTYRDRGDEYVTKRFDLTGDIDTVYRNLQSFVADGGGDDPESVNQGLDDAVNRLSWSADRSVLKIIFLVGDYPPHMDYADDVKYPVTCQVAVRKGILINTVQCGDVPQTTPVWQDIARRAEGSYVALAQSGNMTVMTTPFDEQIAAASAALGATVIAYGDGARREEALHKVESAAGAPASTAADRAAYNLASGGKAIQGRGDLIADMEDGAVDPATVRKDLLPPEMQKMTPPQRAAFIAKQKAARDTLNATLAGLARKRADYISTEQKRLAVAGTGDSFDAKVAEIIAAEAKLSR